MNQELTTITQNLNDDAHQYLTFSVLNESMAVGILDVDEIIEIGDMTRVPMSNNSIRGVINLRGNVVPVIDLSHRLGGRSLEITRRTCIVLVNFMLDGESNTMGMLVDAVNEILAIPTEAIQKTPDFGTDIRHDFIHSMGRIDDEFIILLNIERVLSLDELAQVDAQRTPLHKLPNAVTDQSVN